MHLLVVTASLRAPWCTSLKDKRSVVKPLVQKIRQQFNISANESGHQDSHTMMEITIAGLSFDTASGDSLNEALYGFIQRNTQAEIIAWDAEYR